MTVINNLASLGERLHKIPERRLIVGTVLTNSHRQFMQSGVMLWPDSDRLAYQMRRGELPWNASANVVTPMGHWNPGRILFTNDIL